MLRELDVARDAGFFDGEGCITIQKKKNLPHTVNPAFQFDLWLHNTCFPAVESYLQYGGGIQTVKRKGNQKPLLQWRMTGYPAADVIRNWQPYLMAKAEQAKVALEFLEYKKAHVRQGVRTPPAVLQELERFMHRMHELNRRGRFGKKGYQESFLEKVEVNVKTAYL